MSYVDPTTPSEVKNPKTLYDLLSNEILENASSVSYVYGLASNDLVEFKRLAFQAAALLHQASEMLQKNGAAVTTIVIDKTPGQNWASALWINGVRPVLVGVGVVFVCLSVFPGVLDRVSLIFSGIKFTLGL